MSGIIEKLEESRKRARLVGGNSKALGRNVPDDVIRTIFSF